MKNCPIFTNAVAMNLLNGPTQLMYGDTVVKFANFRFDMDQVVVTLLDAEQNPITSYNAPANTLGGILTLASKLKPQWELTIELN